MSDRPGEGYPYRYNEIIKRLLGGKGGEPLNEVAAELVPSLVLEGPDAPFEYRRLGGIASWGGFRLGGANVGVFTQVGVRTPAAPGSISVVEGFVLRNTNVAATVVQLRLIVQQTLPGFIGPGTVTVHRDTHSLSSATIGPSTSIQEFQNAALQGFPFFSYSLQAAGALGDTILVPNLQLELAPNSAFLVNPNLVNQSVEMSAWGYERVEEPSEAGPR